MLGKFSQKSQFPETMYIKNQKNLETLYETSNIIDIQGISEDICEIQILPEEQELKKTPNRSGNCIIGAFVTAYARIALHEDLQALHLNGFKLCYVDTDGIIFAGPKDKEMPLCVSPCLGDYKHELGKDSEFQLYSCIAKKSYSFSYFNKKTQESGYSIKSSGLSLLSEISSESVSPTKFEKMVLNWQNKESTTISVPQLRTLVLKDENSVHNKLTSFKLSNTLNFCRYLVNVNEMTIPYGYCAK